MAGTHTTQPTQRGRLSDGLDWQICTGWYLKTSQPAPASISGLLELPQPCSKRRRSAPGSCSVLDRDDGLKSKDIRFRGYIVQATSGACQHPGVSEPTLGSWGRDPVCLKGPWQQRISQSRMLSSLERKIPRGSYCGSGVRDGGGGGGWGMGRVYDVYGSTHSRQNDPLELRFPPNEDGPGWGGSGLTDDWGG